MLSSTVLWMRRCVCSSNRPVEGITARRVIDDTITLKHSMLLDRTWVCIYIYTDAIQGINLNEIAHNPKPCNCDMCVNFKTDDIDSLNNFGNNNISGTSFRGIKVIEMTKYDSRRKCGIGISSASVRYLFRTLYLSWVQLVQYFL